MNPKGKPFLILLLATAACDRVPTPEQRTVQRWLLCEECVEGELDSVVALGEPGINELERALNGPPEDRIENMRRQAEAMHARIPSPRTTRKAYVDHYLSNYKALYHSRAITALQRINTPRTHAILIAALRQDARYREDVRRQLGEAVGAKVTTAAGDSQHALLNSFVKVDPTILVIDSTTGHGLSEVRVVFRVDSGGGKVVDSVRLTGSNGRAAVRWQLGPRDSINVLRAVAAGRTVRIRALGHPDGPRIVFLAQPRDARRAQPMTPPARIAIQDPWGATLTNFNQNVVVRVMPINVLRTRNITNGVATLSGLTIDRVGTGFRLTVTSIGARPAASAPFAVTP